MRFNRARTVSAQLGGGGVTAVTDVAPHVARNVDEIVKLENRDRVRMGLSDHFADLMTRFSGSMLFVWLHVVWFGVWIVVNQGWLGVTAFDTFPFGFLTMIVSLEAIFLSTFVLISQNRQALQADRRAKVDLHVNVIAEQEITKVIQMLAEVHEHLGLSARHDPEVQHMRESTRVEQLADAVETAEAITEAPD